MMNCANAPATIPHAAMMTSERSVVRPPKITSVAIITMFMNTGATYDRKNLR